MKITNAHNAQLHKNPHGVSVSKLYDTEHAQIMHMVLKPSESLKKHATPVDVAFYILEGEGIVEIGDEQAQVSADTLIDSPAKIPHKVTNESNNDLRFLVIKVPRQTESTEMLQ